MISIKNNNYSTNSKPALQMDSNSLMEKVLWFSSRLRSMSKEEIIFRTFSYLKEPIYKSGLFCADQVDLEDTSTISAPYIALSQKIDPCNYIVTADAILEGEMNIFELSYQCPISDYQWNRDPLTGHHAPSTFGRSINYRDEAIVGNIKYLWEPARHLHLVTLAQAYHFTHENKYLIAIQQQVESFLTQCPYQIGIHWCSSLEVAIRLINWSITWQLIGSLESRLFHDQQGTLFRRKWLVAIFQHAHFVQRNFSKYSSANNHLIGEAAGLFIATTTWPFWKKFRKWQIQAKCLLERESQLQNHKDGVNREQAISYQQFVLDFFILTVLCGKSNGQSFSQHYLQTIESMLDYVASIMDSAGNVPMIGDADDGYVTKLSQQNVFCPFKSLLATGSVLFNRPEFFTKAQYFDDKSLWLLGDSAPAQINALTDKHHKLPVKSEFNHGGYYILGNNFETNSEIRVVADAGELGYLNLAAHGHADALALTLSVAGQEILIDPGTYAYHTEQKWRNYFRGTSAHNTVTVDGCNQSQIAGNFLWSTKANVFGVSWNTDSEQDQLIACHDGYHRLADPVTHKRTIRYLKTNSEITIEDELSCNKEHYVELFWHCSENCVVEMKEKAVAISNGPVYVVIFMPDQHIEPKINCGDIQSPSGWISRKFDVKKPAPTICWNSTIIGSTILKTTILISIDNDYIY